MPIRMPSRPPDPARAEGRQLRRRFDRVTLGQKPDRLHVARLDRIGAAPETLLQIRNAQMIRDAPHGTALHQGIKPEPISAQGESAPGESMSRSPYEPVAIARITADAGTFSTVLSTIGA